MTALFDDGLIEQAIDSDRPLEIPPRKGVKYVAFINSSGGKHDAYAIAIAHQEGEYKAGRFVADVVRGTRPPFDPVVVTKNYVDLASSYGVKKIVGDRYSADWLAAAVLGAGASYQTARLSRSELYLEILPRFAQGRVSIPAQPQLLNELRLLQRAAHRCGRDTVDHPKNGADDFANALAGAIFEASGQSSKDRYTEGIVNRFGQRGWKLPYALRYQMATGIRMF